MNRQKSVAANDAVHELEIGTADMPAGLTKVPIFGVGAGMLTSRYYEYAL